MSDYLPHKDIRAHVLAYETGAGRGINPGDTVRLNHVGCPAGEDTRERLYLTHRVEASTGVILAYCHNCGGGGALKIGGFGLARSIPGAHGAIPPEDTFEFPITLPLAYPSVPNEAREWVSGVDAAHALNVGLTWNPVTCRVVLPIYDWATFASDGAVARGELVAYQERRIFGHGVKYLTTQKDDTPLESIFLHPKDAKMVALVEDWLSAYVVATNPFVPCHAVPMFRYHIRAEYLAKLAGAYKNIVIWTDNDSERVKDEARHIWRLAQAYGAQAYKLDAPSRKEPKNCDTYEIECALKNAADHFTSR